MGTITSIVLDKLRLCGMIGMSIDKSCVVCGITDADYLASAEATTAYRTGQCQGEFALKQSVFRGAKEGNPQMCKLYISLIQSTIHMEDMELEDIVDCEVTYEQARPDEIEYERVDPATQEVGEQEDNHALVTTMDTGRDASQLGWND